MRFAHALTLLLLCVSLPLLAQTSASFHIDAGSLVPASGHATSSSFGLYECIDRGWGGTASSGSFSAQVGCSAAFSSLAADDDDGDGVSNAIEDASPNGGDANNDGTPDSQQSDVVSFPTPDGYVTFEAGIGCNDITNAAVVTESSLGVDPAFDYPLGLFDISIACTGNDFMAPITVIFHGVSTSDWPPADYRWFDGSFDSLPGVTYGTTSIPGEGTVPTAMFTLIDGGNGDDTGADDTIHNVAGPAAAVAAEIPTASPLALMILALLLAIVAISVPRWS